MNNWHAVKYGAPSPLFFKRAKTKTKIHVSMMQNYGLYKLFYQLLGPGTFSGLVCSLLSANLVEGKIWKAVQVQILS
jgi:hypothetical protein